VGGCIAIAAVALVILARWQKIAEPSERPIHALAVLPLENLSGDPEQEYFADGLTDQLITDLAQIGALRVISRGSVMPLSRAVQALTKAVDLSGGRMDFQGSLGYVYATSGQREAALRMLKRLESESAKRRVSPFVKAQITVGLGDKDKTYTYLNQAFREHSSSVLTLRDDPSFDPVHDDPRMQELLRRLNLPK
jgi:hypothetical protein